MDSKYWNAILTLLFVYFNAYVVYEMNYFPPKMVDLSVVSMYFFRMPYIADFVLIISVFFHLVNIAFKFQTLYNCLIRLPIGLRSVSNMTMHLDTVTSMEYVRLLHAELSELLRIFNLGFGPLMLAFFVLSFIDTIYLWFIMICYIDEMTEAQYTQNTIKYMVLHGFKLQNMIFAMSIIVAASNINEKVYLYLALLLTIKHTANE